MSSYDAVFLSVAASLFFERSRARFLAALVPLAAFALEFAPLGDFRAPAAALAAVALCPRAAPVALLLAVPRYASFAEALRTALAWPAAVVLFESVESRLEEGAIPWRLRGAPVRLVVCAALYYVLHPVAFL